MAFEGPTNEEKEMKAHEIAVKLDEIVLDEDIEILRQAINFMGENTREKLLMVIESK